MIKNILLSFCILLSLSSFLGFFEDPPYCRMVNNITSSYNKTLKKKHGLRVIGSGGGMMYDVEEIGLHYVSDKRLNIQETRILFTDIVEGLLEKINADKKLRPFLHNYPFTIENLDISISFADASAQWISENFVALAFNNSQNKIVYEAYTPHPPHKDSLLTGSFKSLHEETYTEALRMITLESQKTRDK